MGAFRGATTQENQRTSIKVPLFAFAVSRVAREHATQGAVNAPSNVCEHRDPPCNRWGRWGWRWYLVARVPLGRRVISNVGVAIRSEELHSIKLNSSPPAHGERLYGEGEHTFARGLVARESV